MFRNVRARPKAPTYALRVVHGFEELSAYHRRWSDHGLPQPLEYSDMIAWLDEEGYKGDERVAALRIMRTCDTTWRRKKIEEIELNRPSR